MSKNILLFGSNGYLGNNLKIRLSKKFDVYEFNRKEIKLFFLGEIDFFTDVTFDAFFNLAVNYDDESNVSELIKSNYLLSIEILEKIKKSKNFKIFHFDTFYSKFYTVTTQSTYLLSKKNLIEWSKIFHKKNKGVTTFMLRLEHVVGFNESKKKFNGWLIDKLKKNESINLGVCDHSFDFIYINDILDSIIILLDSKKFSNKFICLDIGSGKSYRLKTFVNLVKSKLNSKSKVIFNKNRKLDAYKNQSSIANNKELKELGWNPKSDLDEIIDLIL